jgi:hypothetical protein
MTAYIVSQNMCTNPKTIYCRASYTDKERAEQCRDYLKTQEDSIFDISEYIVKGCSRCDRDEDFWYLITAGMMGKKKSRPGDLIITDVFASFEDAEEYGLTVMDQYESLAIWAIPKNGSCSQEFRIKSKCDK